MHFIRVRWDCVLHISRYKKKKRLRDFCSDLNWWKSVSHQLISNLLLLSFFNLTPKDHWLNKENTSLPDCWSFFGKKLHNCISYWVNEQWFSNEIFRIHLTIKMTFQSLQHYQLPFFTFVQIQICLALFWCWWRSHELHSTLMMMKPIKNQQFLMVIIVMIQICTFIHIYDFLVTIFSNNYFWY